MRALHIVSLVWLVLSIAGLINFVRAGRDFHIAQILPFCGGKPVNGEYAVAGIIMLGLILWGIGRINRNNKEDEK